MTLAETRPAAPAPTLSPEPEVLTGAAAVVRSLELLSVTDVFGLPGGAILPVYDALMDSTALRHILVRHEQGGGHAAEGYAEASGKTGVVIATSGPGATNLVTALADAHMDSVPLLAITGQVNSKLIGTDAFQEADIVGITLPITKHSFLVDRAEDIPATLATAYHIASTGRPGPVLVDITKDAQQASAPFNWDPAAMVTEGYTVPSTKVSRAQLQAAAAFITEAKRPVLYVGGGVIRAGASAQLAELAHHVGAPVVTTLMARGAFPDSDPLNLGMPGMHGTVPAVLALQEADLLVTLGARFDDRVTGPSAQFAPDAKVIHVDIDPAEIGKIRAVDVPIVGDLAHVLPELLTALRAEGGTFELGDWWHHLNELRGRYPLGYTPTADGLLSPQHVIQRLGQLSGPQATYVSGVGQHQMWAAQFIQYERPNSWLNSGGAGTMGYAVPAAMGAKVAEPARTVWAIDGDGCFQMTNQELATCVLNNIPIKVAVINNSSLGMVRQWQNLFYEERYSHTHLNTGHDTVRVPDFVKMADAYGMQGRLVERQEDVDAAIEWALSVNDAPVLLEFVVSADAHVFPMVPQGVSNSSILYAKEHAPAWEE